MVVGPPTKDLRERLIVPVAYQLGASRHAALVESTLDTAAEQLVRSGLFWKWDRRKMDGGWALKRWDVDMFVSFDTRELARFLGEKFRIFDTDNQEWAKPSISVTARIHEKLLNHPDLPQADWALTMEKRNEDK